MARRALSEPDLGLFWHTARELLVLACGQSGRRNRETMRRRRAWAEELGVEDVTVRAFLNGIQRTLGENPRQRLCARVPELARIYKTCLELATCAVSEPSAVQLILKLEGFVPTQSPIGLKLPPGRACLINLSVMHKVG